MTDLVTTGHDDLVLPGAISETSLDLPDGLAFDEWERVGETLRRIGQAHQFWIGDWLNYGESAYGEKYTQALELTDYDHKTLRNIAYVMAQVEVSRRRDGLSFSHHAEVAALDPDEQQQWLDRAEREDLSVAALRRAIKQQPPDEAHEQCPTCGRPLSAKYQLPRRGK